MSFEFDGTEKFGHHFRAVRGAYVKRNARNGRQGHEASMPHCRSARVTRTCFLSIFGANLIFFSVCFQYEFFFENATLPLMADAPEYASVSPPELQTNLLLDNLSKLERECFSIHFVNIP